MTVPEIEKRYKALSTEKLIQLAKEAHTLRPEVIPVLKNELISRGEEAEAQSMDSNLAEQSDLKNLSLREIQELVSDRLLTGESIESIKLDLTDNGVDIADLFNHESEQREKAFEFIATSKQSGLDESILNQKLVEDFKLEENEIPVLKKEMKSRGNAYTIIGAGLTCVALVLIMLAVIEDGVRFRNGFVLLAVGVSLVMKGIRHSKA